MWQGQKQALLGYFTPEKKIFNSRVSRPDPGTGWVKAGVRIYLDSKTLGGLWLTSKSGEFWQIMPKLGFFSTRTEKDDFTGVSGTGTDLKKGIGA